MNIQVFGVAHSLQNMFKSDKYFSICTIKELIHVTKNMKLEKKR